MKQVSLYTFAQNEYHRLYCFEKWYMAMHELNPVEFPMNFEDNNCGMWDETFAGYCIEDEVYKLESNYTKEEVAEFEREVQESYYQEDLRKLKDKRILLKQKRKLSQYLYSQLEWILEFYETTWDYEIVKTLGEFATKDIDNFHELPHLFTDIEYHSDYSGEMYSGGEVWVPIKNGNYFKFSFGI